MVAMTAPAKLKHISSMPGPFGDHSKNLIAALPLRSQLFDFEYYFPLQVLHIKLSVFVSVTKLLVHRLNFRPRTG